MRITDYRLTFIFFEPVLDLLTGALDEKDVEDPSLVVREPFIAWFDEIQAKRKAADAPAQPWPAHGNQGFWLRQLKGEKSLAHVSGAVAWRNVVPARVPRIAEVAADMEETRAYTEGLAHPWGVALLVNVACTHTWNDPDHIASDVIAWRREARYLLNGRPASLDKVAAAGLARLRGLVFAPGDSTDVPEPFSVFTMVRGRGTPTDLDPAANEGLRRLIQTGSSFSPTWEWDELAPLDTARVARINVQPASHGVYGTTRGRTIWGPAHLAQASGKHTLSCQHRNLVLASGMTLSLMHLAHRAVSDVGVGQMGGDLDAIARRGMVVLGGMYLGGESSFKSGSVKRQVDDDPDRRTSVNALRQRFNLTPSLGT